MRNKIFVSLLVFSLGFGVLVYQKNFSDKAKLIKCANINLLAKQLIDKFSRSDSGKAPRNYLNYKETLKHKLKYPQYEKEWDDCEFEFKNSPIKFHEKYPGEFNRHYLFRKQ